MRAQTVLRVMVMALAAGTAASARADYVVDVTESGGNVVATGSGTIHTAALTFVGNGAGEALLNGLQNVALFGTNLTVEADLYIGLSGPGAFGTLDNEVLASSGTGDLVGVTSGAGVGVPSDPLLLWLPNGYVSGTQLDTTDTWAGESFASLGLTVGTYTWTWGSGVDADSFTLNIRGRPVPEPSGLALVGIGAIGIGLFAGRRRATRPRAS